MTKHKQFLYRIFLLSVLASLFIYSCNTAKTNNEKNNVIENHVAEKTLDIELSLGKIEKYLEIEKRQNSIDVTRKYFVDIDEGIYPYIKNHSFEIPREFEVPTEKAIELNKSYYYTNEGDVKLILYEWNASNRTEVENGKFKSIFLAIEKKVSEKIGPSSLKNIESEKIKTDDTFRDDIKWETQELNAYLFRFGDRNNDYNQIRLAIYKD
ncbi:hypothetical protein ACFFLS_07060 [Flavobacterium procerum]|uniref:LPS export ABC transporter periplasmic protein LptC n=1 Tax=Flavobacterium procerum TaxID=1455569 RepID=A0ABV6BMW9_9FLAO